MYRRLISTSVLAAFVAAQLAAMPHAHAHRTPVGHDAVPHVRLRAAPGTSHHHDHGHAHAPGHVHRHAAPTVGRHGDSHEGVLSDTADHDVDAVYLPTSVSLALRSGADQCQLVATLAILQFIDGAQLIDALTASTMGLPCPPDKHAPSCARYLALRALRI